MLDRKERVGHLGVPDSHLGTRTQSMSGIGRPLAALILLLLALETAANSEVLAMEIGEPFPLILLPSLDDGHPASIADFRGRKLVLHIWAAW